MSVYGSGALGDWSASQRAISTPEIIAQVLAADGLFMAGDSISVATARELAEMLLPSGDLLAVHNWSGRPTAPAVDALIGWLNTYGWPRRILMATGTNDIFDPTVMSAQVDRMMVAAGPLRKVMWVSVQCARWNSTPEVELADQRNTGWVNAQLYEASARWPNLRVIPWHRWLAVSPARLGMYLKDGVHVTLPGAPYIGSTFRNTIIRDFILNEKSP